LKYYSVGRIVNTHGIKGELKIVPLTDFPEKRFLQGEVVYLFEDNNNYPIELRISSMRNHKNMLIIKFNGYDNINEVEKWKGKMLHVSEIQLHELEEGEYYYHQIIGAKVVTTENESIGNVIDVLSYPANDVWLIKDTNGNELLIPVVDEIIKDVDIANKLITIKWMEGLR